VDGLDACDCAKPARGHVDVARLNLDAETAPASTLGSDQRGAGADEGVEHDPAAPRTVEDRILDQRDRLHCRMHSQRRVALGAKCVHAGVFPKIAAIAPIAAEIDVVDVTSTAVLENGD
jgi:hypothetical protein